MTQGERYEATVMFSSETVLSAKHGARWWGFSGNQNSHGCSPLGIFQLNLLGQTLKGMKFLAFHFSMRLRPSSIPFTQRDTYLSNRNYCGSLAKHSPRWELKTQTTQNTLFFNKQRFYSPRFLPFCPLKPPTACTVADF